MWQSGLTDHLNQFVNGDYKKAGRYTISALLTFGVNRIGAH